MNTCAEEVQRERRKQCLENTPKKEIEERSARLHLFREWVCVRDDAIAHTDTRAFIKICDVEMHIMEDELVFVVFILRCFAALLVVDEMQILMKMEVRARRRDKNSIKGTIGWSLSISPRRFLETVGPSSFLKT